MKKILYLAVFVIVAAIIYSGAGTSAENNTFAERFGADKKQIGESG